MEKVIIIGHGSPKKDANILESVGKRLHMMLHPGCRDECVRTAYLQFEEPGITERIDSCVRDGARRIILFPYFLCAGMHVTEDIPQIVENARNLYPQVEFIYAEPFGLHEKLIQVARERIQTATGKGPSDIERRSFEIIGEEMDLSALPQEQRPIVQRVIHATADFEFRDSLVFHPHAVETGILAIRAGKHILTDVEMVRTGIKKRIVEKWGGKVVCGIRDVGNSAHYNDTRTRSEQGIEKILSENDSIGIIAVGNAPTALLRAITMVPEYTGTNGSTPLLIGVPVGFVNALESKTQLAAQDFPFITNLSRKGGTPAAVAIVNALLKMAEVGQ